MTLIFPFSRHTSEFYYNSLEQTFVVAATFRRYQMDHYLQKLWRNRSFSCYSDKHKRQCNLVYMGCFSVKYQFFFLYSNKRYPSVYPSFVFLSRPLGGSRLLRARFLLFVNKFGHNNTLDRELTTKAKHFSRFSKVIISCFLECARFTRF